jgi:hypothetical protein
MTWVIVLATFFEPNHRNETFTENNTDTAYGINIFAIEMVPLAFFLVDLLLLTVHKFQDKTEPMVKHFIKNSGYVSIFLYCVILLADFISMAVLYPKASLRFGRFVRWGGWIIYSQEMKKVFKGIVSSTRALLVFTVFFFLFLFLYGWIGTALIGYIKFYHLVFDLPTYQNLVYLIFT